MSELIDRQEVIKALCERRCGDKPKGCPSGFCTESLAVDCIPSAQPEGYIKIPETGIDDLSDGFHTFRQLYYQRMMLFATIVKQNGECYKWCDKWYEYADKYQGFVKKRDEIKRMRCHG